MPAVLSTAPITSALRVSGSTTTHTLLTFTGPTDPAPELGLTTSEAESKPAPQAAASGVTTATTAATARPARPRRERGDRRVVLRE